MARKNIEALYDVLFTMRSNLEDIVQDAEGLLNDVAEYGGEMNRVLKEQLSKYFIPGLTALIKDEKTPGSIIGIIRFMDSLPLAMTRVEPSVENVAPVVPQNASIDRPVNSAVDTLPQNASYQNQPTQVQESQEEASRTEPPFPQKPSKPVKKIEEATGSQEEEDIRDWVQNIIDDWKSDWEDGYDGCSQAALDIISAKDWFLDHMDNFTEVYGYELDSDAEELISNIVDDYVDETIDYLEDSRDKFEHLRQMVMSGITDASYYDDDYDSEEDEDWDEEEDDEDDGNYIYDSLIINSKYRLQEFFDEDSWRKSKKGQEERDWWYNHVHTETDNKWRNKKGTQNFFACDDADESIMRFGKIYIDDTNDMPVEPNYVASLLKSWGEPVDPKSLKRRRESEEAEDDDVLIYQVVRTSDIGSSLGEDVSNVEPTVVSEFDCEDCAKAKAEELNQTVTPGEKAVLGTEYDVQEKEIEV